jgi:ribonuclease BN (tRNA processing enzyme)
MRLSIIGCSDAFGTGGRLQTCYHVRHAGGEFLIDCGATALIGLHRLGLDPNRIPAIFISHLHGDHFSGLVWWLIHANHVSSRRDPLTVTGPAGIEARFKTTAEALFPDCTKTPLRFDFKFVEYGERQSLTVSGVTVTPFEVSHPSGAPPYALRFDVEGRTIAFSGDTEWTESLIGAATGADLFIAECFGYENEVRFHMNWRTIERNIPRLGAKRILLTHMGPAMLPHRAEITDPRVLIAEDGLEIDI